MLVSVIVGVLVVLATELALRLPGVPAVMGRPDLYYSADVQVRLEALRNFQASRGRVDVLFAGSSVVRVNVSPTAFDEYLQAHGISVDSFNGGLAALWPAAELLYLENFWLKEADPQVIVQAIRYEELVNPTPAVDFAGLSTGRYEALWDDNTLGARIRAFLLDNSSLARYSGRLTDLLADPANKPGAQVRFGIDDRGFSGAPRTLDEWLEHAEPRDIPGGNAATMGFSEPIDPSTFADGLHVLSDTIAVARRNGVEYVLVNMPEHGDKFLSRSDGEERYRFYVQILSDFAADQGVPFIDLTNGDAAAFASNEPFADFHHMNVEGALQFTRELAEVFLERGLLGGDRVSHLARDG